MASVLVPLKCSIRFGTTKKIHMHVTGRGSFEQFLLYHIHIFSGATSIYIALKNRPEAYGRNPQQVGSRCMATGTAALAPLLLKGLSPVSSLLQGRGVKKHG